MRALVVLVLAVVEVAIVLVAVYLVYSGLTALKRGRQTQPPKGRWQALHYADDGDMVVAVARQTPDGHVIEKHVVARIPDADEDWSGTFLKAKLEAEERAFHLNADTPP